MSNEEILKAQITELEKLVELKEKVIQELSKVHKVQVQYIYTNSYPWQQYPWTQSPFIYGGSTSGNGMSLNIPNNTTTSIWNGTQTTGYVQQAQTQAMGQQRHANHQMSLSNDPKNHCVDDGR